MSGPTSKPRYFAPKRERRPCLLGECRHCGARRVSRPRGLGWKCYYTPGLKELYPSRSKYAKRSPVKDTNKRPTLPDAPTEFYPGAEDKVKVMEERAPAGHSLWHPADSER